MKVWFSIKCKQNKDWEVLETLKSFPKILETKIIEVEQNDLKKKKKNQWSGTIFIKVNIEKNKLPKDIRDFILQIPDFFKFNSYEKGYHGNPIFISEREFKKILKSAELKNILSFGKFKPKDIDFEINDLVMITHGVFRGYEGEVIEIDYDTGKIIVNVEFFGRLTPTKVGFLECKGK